MTKKLVNLLCSEKHAVTALELLSLGYHGVISTRSPLPFLRTSPCPESMLEVHVIVNQTFSKALQVREVGAEVVVLLLKLVQLVLRILRTVGIPKGSFKVGEHVGVVRELGEAVRDLGQRQLIGLSSQPAGNTCQAGRGSREPDRRI